MFINIKGLLKNKKYFIIITALAIAVLIIVIALGYFFFGESLKIGPSIIKTPESEKFAQEEKARQELIEKQLEKLDGLKIQFNYQTPAKTEISKQGRDYQPPTQEEIQSQLKELDQLYQQVKEVKGR